VVRYLAYHGHDALQGKPLPEKCITFAEFVVVDLPFLEETLEFIRVVVPEPEPLVKILPAAFDRSERSVAIKKNDLQRHSAVYITKQTKNLSG
jgi:hypothetical protein